MLNSHLILATGWILFCALHSVFASSIFKQWAAPLMGVQYKYYRLYYSFFAVLSFAAIIIYLLNINSYKLFTSTKLTIMTGIAATAGGIAIMGICVAKYFMQLSGLKGLIHNKTNNELMITGVHKVVRHPLYAGTFIFIWGLLILFPSLSLFISDAMITLYTLIALRFEEKKLEKEFGDAYRVYKEKVPMIIPKFSW
jgi:protein-S-isoprenylcysteine O-methyltransferase Ste14